MGQIIRSLVSICLSVLAIMVAFYSQFRLNFS